MNVSAQPLLSLIKICCFINISSWKSNQTECYIVLHENGIESGYRGLVKYMKRAALKFSEQPSGIHSDSSSCKELAHNMDALRYVFPPSGKSRQTIRHVYRFTDARCQQMELPVPAGGDDAPEWFIPGVPRQ